MTDEAFWRGWVKGSLLAYAFVGGIIVAWPLFGVAVARASYEAGATDARQAMPLSCTWDSTTKRDSRGAPSGRTE